ncbi:PREDICTED: putative polypeptide N-acetylgalactosaminyltransferase-like protein 3 [Lepidothrix coronata]|uniref:polypeptide N-acetylgalactosaminyltransferase n=1 Tax=Lepidothrix coronata TaxID=321398 RepID=A0A6J0HYC3_9PASS|nr:PREDICTED: putative polypeptide N-acetylgalactosaminyltransferase-like protein 3 [Lepidothrix coronata]
MASLRRVKVLLVLNLIAVAGFVLFLAKCRPITAKSGDSFHDIHPRAEVANSTAHGGGSIQDAVLKRLSLLEDIVYRQLNGLSKSLGLIEGYGGRGKGGLPATLSPEEEEKAKGPHEKYGYNSYLSEKISLDRSIPDYRPTKAEPVLSRIQENRKRVILPSIDNIKQDNFEVQRYENSAHGYSWELWCMYISPPKDWWDAGDPSLPIRTPAMIGCSFVVNRKFFGEIGLLDPGMDVYGGENIELGIKVWLCGGSMEVLPCSRVAHIERKKKPYNNNIGFYTKRNALRVAEVWMDDYKWHVYIAWNLPLENPGIDIGDVSERKALRKSLKCKNFQWYLDHVYPEMRRYNNTIAYGELRNNKAKDVCLDQGPQENHTAILYPCHGWGPQLARYTKEGFLHLGALGTTTLLPDTRCLVDNGKSRFPQLLDCEKVKSSLHKRWSFIQNGAILNKGTGRCLEVENKGMAGIDLILRSCTGQRWTIKNFIK